MSMEYAVVDIETTGGYPADNGITEIAIYTYNGAQASLAFHSLINPKKPIPLAIVALTGITDEMVQQAPTFVEIAPRIHALLQERIFVAHNVNFDYSFIKHHLLACGYSWNPPKLCTVRLSRKFFPGLASYSLGKLCHQLQIPIRERHRAHGDAEATTKLLAMIVHKDQEGWIQQTLKRTSKEQVLPSNLAKEDFLALPHSAGVYYFKNQKGKVIYVGKAKDIKSRVSSHFSGQNPNAQRQHFLRDIHAIDFKLSGTELMAFLWEALEIKKLWPENNRALKRFEPRYGLYQYEDQLGYKRLAIDKHKKYQGTVHSFGSLREAHIFLTKLIQQYQLCPKLCAIYHGSGACQHYGHQACFGACLGEEVPTAYNRRFDQALADMKQQLPSFILIDKGRHAAESSCVWVEKGQLCGIGYIDREEQIPPEKIKDQLTPCLSNNYMMQLIAAHALKYPEKLRAI